MTLQNRASDGFPLAVLVEGGLALFAAFLAWLFGVSLRDQVPATGWEAVRATARGILATAPMLALFWLLVHSPRPALSQLRQQVEWIVREIFPTGSYAQFAVVALLAGVGEELLFRGVLQTKLIEWTTPAVGVVIGGIVFGFAHALSKMYFLLATLIGIYFGWMVLAFGELLSPMIAHALYDFVALAYLFHSAHSGRGDAVTESSDHTPNSSDE